MLVTTLPNTTEIMEIEAKEETIRSNNTMDFGKASLSTMLETEAELQGIEKWIQVSILRKL